MYSSDDIVVEDWDELESEIERLMIIYGYPTENENSSGSVGLQTSGGESGRQGNEPGSNLILANQYTKHKY